ERRYDTPRVGRQEHLEQLRGTCARAVQDRSWCLLTLLGPVGIGKTRLAAELFDQLAEEATILVGRCLPYGDGITFWPLTEVLQDLGGAERIAQVVSESADGALILERLRCFEDGAAADSQEMFWAVRRLCEALGNRRPPGLWFV